MHGAGSSRQGSQQELVMRLDACSTTARARRTGDGRAAARAHLRHMASAAHGRQYWYLRYGQRSLLAQCSGGGSVWARPCRSAAPDAERQSAPRGTTAKSNATVPQCSDHTGLGGVFIMAHGRGDPGSNLAFQRPAVQIHMATVAMPRTTWVANQDYHQPVMYW
jgi:hypothetical protein